MLFTDDIRNIKPPDSKSPLMQYGDTYSKMVHCAVTLDKSFAQCLNREYRTVNKIMLLNYKCLIYDVNNVGMEEKFINTIIFCTHGSMDLVLGVDTPIFRKWQQKVDFQFGFVPFGGQLMPDNTSMCHSHVFPH